MGSTPVTLDWVIYSTEAPKSKKTKFYLLNRQNISHGERISSVSVKHWHMSTFVVFIITYSGSKWVFHHRACSKSVYNPKYTSLVSSLKEMYSAQLFTIVSSADSSTRSLYMFFLITVLSSTSNLNWPFQFSILIFYIIVVP